MTRDQVRQALQLAVQGFDTWSLRRQMDAETPRQMDAEQVFDHLFRHEPLEWSNVPAFQAVLVRVLASRLLETRSNTQREQTQPKSVRDESAGSPKPRSLRNRDVFVESERLHERVHMYLPRARQFHLFVSRTGAAQLVEEANASFAEGALRTTDDMHHVTVRACSCMLLHLTARTWTNGELSASLAREVLQALAAGADIILAHEQPSIEVVLDSSAADKAGRYACKFGEFFSTTPSTLLRSHIYNREMAIPMTGGAARAASLRMLVQEIATRTRRKQLCNPKRPAVEPHVLEVELAVEENVRLSRSTSAPRLSETVIQQSVPAAVSEQSVSLTVSEQSVSPTVSEQSACHFHCDSGSQGPAGVIEETATEPAGCFVGCTDAASTSTSQVDEITVVHGEMCLVI
jgi:hypothetical protein